MSLASLKKMVASLEKSKARLKSPSRKRSHSHMGMGGVQGVGYPAKFGMHRTDGQHTNVSNGGRMPWEGSAPYHHSGIGVGGRKRGRPRKHAGIGVGGALMGGALMGGDWDNMSGTFGGKKRGRPRKHAGIGVGGMLMGGDWDNMSGTFGGIHRGLPPRMPRPPGVGGMLMGGDWDNMSGTYGGSLMGGDWDNMSGTFGGIVTGGRRRRHMGMGGANVGSDWVNMPGYQGSGKKGGKVNFTNNETFYPPPKYIEGFDARYDMARRNYNNRHSATSNTAGLSGGKGHRKGVIPPQLRAWNHLVDEVQKKHGCKRGEAMKIAKGLYHKK